MAMTIPTPSQATTHAAPDSPAQAALELLCRKLAAVIPDLDEWSMTAARARQAALTKPLGALGRLEELAIHLAGITGQVTPLLPAKAMLVAAGDHGVWAEGVSPYPQSVTAQMVANFLAGGAAINVLARQAGARVTVLNCGLAHALPAVVIPETGTRPDDVRLVHRPIAPATRNFVLGPAMTASEASDAIQAGVQVVEEELAQGLDLLGLGEMGIGNTTAAAAIACALTGLAPATIVGVGAGLDAAGVAAKAAVVARGLAVNHLRTEDVAPCAAQDPDFGLRVLCAVGGFELAALVGAILAAAARRVPVVIDGYIVTAAAMLAVRIAPKARAMLIPAHRSAEAGHAHMLDWLGMQPYLALDMRLGEGTGAALAMLLIDAACHTLAHMATFGEAGVANKS